MRWHALAALSLLVLTSVTSDAQQPPQPSPKPSVQGYGDTDKACLVWNDQCRTCWRLADDGVQCSNIPIACQPGPITCSRRREEPAKK